MTAFRPVHSEVHTREDEFRGVYHRHYPAVFGYAARRLGPDDAPDAAAEVFTIAWRKITSVPAEPETLPWLYGVSRRVVANTLRSRDRRRRLEARAADHIRPPGEEGVPLDLMGALAALSPDDAEILRLAAWEGLSTDDLAAVLGCSPGAAAVRLHRARRRLADTLNDPGAPR